MSMVKLADLSHINIRFARAGGDFGGEVKWHANWASFHL